MVIDSITQAVGNTPLLHLHRFCDACGLPDNIFAKLEMSNPYSVKDRPALSMLDGAGDVRAVVEATSGNTGIGLCMACAARGIPITIVMPENASLERKKIMRLLGAKLVLTSRDGGMAEANAKAREILGATPGAVMCSQFDNPDNIKAHRATAKEIEKDVGKADIFVSAVGTGGTFTGVSRYLKSVFPHLKAYAVEPSASPVLSGGKPAPHRIPGIGAGFVPENFDKEVCDGIIAVDDAAALAACKKLAKYEGVLAGISSGAALKACAELAARYPDKVIVTVFPDSLERYLSTLEI